MPVWFVLGVQSSATETVVGAGAAGCDLVAATFAAEAEVAVEDVELEPHAATVRARIVAASNHAARQYGLEFSEYRLIQAPS
jgi:hypothetical protein